MVEETTRATNEETVGNARANRRVVVACLGALAVMGAVTAVSPALYRIFCQATGYGGTTQRAVAPSDKILDRTMEVRFDANVSPHFIGWKFEPVERTKTVRIGETSLAFFKATNTSDKPLTGTAAFNVAPEAMGLYFSKIECFCFTEQTLQPGQSVDMPVSFFIDPKMVDDRDAAGLSNLTLSYVFYPVHKTADVAPAAKSNEIRGQPPG